MKYTRLLLFVCLITVSTSSLKAQDLHFTLFDMAPLWLNPANTGAFLGTARLGGIYRSQFYKATQRGYKTPVGYIDAPILAIGKRDWIGVGLMFTSLGDDNASSLQLKTSGSLFSGSFHKVLGKKGASVLTLGVQGGQSKRRLVNTSSLVFGDQVEQSLNGVNNPITMEDLANELEKQFFDLNAGLMLRSQLQDDRALEIGFAVDHIMGTDYGLVRESNRPLTFVGHAGMTFNTSKSMEIKPSVLFQATEGSSEIVLQTRAGYLFDAEKQLRLNAGLGYRIGDALQVLLGADIKDIRVGVGYDLPLNDFGGISDRGGFELAASYIIKIYKTPEVPPAIFCPDF